MAADFKPAKGLNARVAAMVAPQVHDIAQRVERSAKGFAPPEKVWQSRGDALVRPEHRKAHGQAVPENLRFVVRSPQYDIAHYGVGPEQLLRFPGDPDGSPGAVINCRCVLEINPDGVSDKIEAGRPIVSGPRVRVVVKCTHKRAAESEFGTDSDEPARFMGRAIADVAARMR